MLLKNTLKSIVMCFQLSESWDASDIFHLDRLGIAGSLSFRNFLQLEEIEAPSILLLGAYSYQAPLLSDQLPRELCQLNLRDDVALLSIYPWRSPAVLKVLEDWSDDLPQCTPNLKVLGLVLAESGPNPHLHPSHAEIYQEVIEDWDENARSTFFDIGRRHDVRCFTRHTPVSLYGTFEPWPDTWADGSNPPTERIWK